MKFYAVAIGRITGIFETWDETKAQVNGYSGARHKSFKSRKEAQEFIYRHKNESDPDWMPPPPKPVV
ncbi:Ribonuclease H [Fusarium duplospermum]|uniref:ribonuclease H n=1 Tax=Fusarium duplospermum TaxID=1325734 RepID=A0A428PVD3_9HYPO|nr:Ribonuclease H [Fusarium duplospermum]